MWNSRKLTCLDPPISIVEVGSLTMQTHEVAVHQSRRPLGEDEHRNQYDPLQHAEHVVVALLIESHDREHRQACVRTSVSKHMQRIHKLARTNGPIFIVPPVRMSAPPISFSASSTSHAQNNPKKSLPSHCRLAV